MLHHAPDSALDRMVGLRNLSDSDELRVKATEDSYAWTERVLTDEDRNFLKKAEDHPVELKSGECVLLHASPCDPVGNEGNYLRSVEDAEEALARLAENPLVRVCFFGHTHIASAYQQVVLDRPYANVKEYRFNDLRRPISLVNASGGLPARWLVNPGSVGQPRDGVREASYALFDNDQWGVEFRRVAYDWQKTVDAINAISIDSMSGDSKNVLSRRIETGGRE
jgi:diadenosine tetraphosphatase ApaH/serine/threonine PP2A family protein phosphatase